MSPSRLRLLALPTAPCKHGALFSFSFALEREFNSPPPSPSSWGKKKLLQWPLTSVVRTALKFTLMMDSVHSVLYTTLAPPHVTFVFFFFALGPRTNTNNFANKDRGVFSVFSLQLKKKRNWSQAETPVVFLQQFIEWRWSLGCEEAVDALTPLVEAGMLQEVKWRTLAEVACCITFLWFWGYKFVQITTMLSETDNCFYWPKKSKNKKRK